MRPALFLSALLASVTADSGDSGSSDVIDLTAANFKSTIDASPLILVEFMAPWCGHCKALAPDYAKAAGELKPLSIPLAKVDCTAEADLCSEHGISGYPTLKIFVAGASSDYNGPRKADGIVSYMKRRSLPVVSHITSANHTEFAHSDRVVVIAYFKSPDPANLTIFQNYADTKRDEYIFGAVEDSSSIPEVSSVGTPAIVVWKKFDEGRNDFHGEKFTVENIAKFVESSAVPLLDEVTPNNFALYADSGLPLAYVFIEANNPSRESLLKTIEPIAKQHKGAINLVWIDADKFADHAKSLGLGFNWPAFAIQDIKAQTKFPMPSTSEVNAENIGHFLKSFADGKLKPSLKSQPVPKHQGPGSHVLVADQFDEVMYGHNNQRDIFVEFYAPWCGHCKRLKPIWDNLAHSFKGAGDKLLITKFDATENDVPNSSGISVQGFPTLKFKPAGSKEFLDYDGDRSLDSLIEFVEKHSVNKVKAVKVELPEEVEGGAGGDQIVLDSEEESVDDDKDAEHDEL